MLYIYIHTYIYVYIKHICNNNSLIYPLNCKACGKQNVGVLSTILEVNGTTINNNKINVRKDESKT